MGLKLETDGDLVEDFVGKMKLTDDRGKNDGGVGVGRGGDEEEEEEFSFDCVGVDNGFSISADDIFHNGQIRPVFPLSGQSLLFREVDEENKLLAGAALRPPVRKLFVEEGSRSRVSTSSAEEPEGPYCSWAGKAVNATLEHHGACKKSNSTGFSKLRRFRELVLRSNSDGKDTFVFLHNHNNYPAVPTSNSKSKSKSKTSKAADKKGAGNVTGKKDETASSVHEKYYGRRRKKDGTASTKGVGNKRRSYLPYRQDLVGFFMSANGLSKNVHPF